MQKSLMKKVAIVFALALVVLLFKIFGFDQYLTLGYLKESQANFARLYSENRFSVIAVYMLIYVTVTALSLPGALILTLAGGALFGLVAGTIIISFASTIGATLACLVSRFLLQQWVQATFGERLKVINEGIEREGGFYLFTLRLVPAFPFFVINLVMGLTSMPLLTFYWVSQLGMLPGTIVYVNAGKELSRIDSLAGILSPGLIISFVILGSFPLVMKKLLDFWKKRKSPSR